MKNVEKILKMGSRRTGRALHITSPAGDRQKIADHYQQIINEIERQIDE
jgi:hypothetical protein